MLAVVEEHKRDQDDQQLRFLQAIRIAVPACLDNKSAKPFEKLEDDLLGKINS
jgi:hypothetical protein